MTKFYKYFLDLFPGVDSHPRFPPPESTPEFWGRESGAGIDLGESQLPIPAPGLAPGILPPEFRGRNSGGGKTPGTERPRNAGGGIFASAPDRGREPEFRGRAVPGIPGVGPSPEFRGWIPGAGIRGGNRNYGDGFRFFK